MIASPNVRIGTAGWSIPRASAPRFASAGTHLQRYANELRCAEINSSFYRPLTPGGWSQLAYFRLHGSPRPYWSKYDEPFIASLATAVRSLPAAKEVWCVFDNTASGAALENAWELRELVASWPTAGRRAASSRSARLRA